MNHLHPHSHLDWFITNQDNSIIVYVVMVDPSCLQPIVYHSLVDNMTLISRVTLKLLRWPT